MQSRGVARVSKSLHVALCAPLHVRARRAGALSEEVMEGTGRQRRRAATGIAHLGRVATVRNALTAREKLLR